MPPLVGKHVLVIGGSSGIGFAVAHAALAEGARVTIASSGAEKVRAAVARLGGGDAVRGEKLDVKQESEVKAFFERIETVDHLVFTAGDPRNLGRGDTSTMDVDAMKARLDVRYFGVILCARHSKGRLTESFTTTSGTLVLRPLPGMSNTIGGGGALVAATRALALDLAPVRANCIMPGLVMTEMWEAMPKETREGFAKAHAEKIPVRHAGMPDEVAEAYLFAMKCSYLTGQTVVVDGGSTLV